MSSFIKKNKKPTTTLTAVEDSKSSATKDHVASEVIANDPLDAETKELIEKHVNPLVVKDALRALIKYENNQSEASRQTAGKRNLFDEQQVKSVLLQLEFTRYNSTLQNVKPIRIRIPHSFHRANESNSDYEFNICLITKSNQKAHISRFFETFEVSSELQGYFEQNSLIPINYSKQVTVYSINDLKTYFKDYKSRKELLKNFTHFFVDSEISLYVYNLLGKVFQEHNKYPVPLFYTKNLSSVSASLEQQKALAEGSTDQESGNIEDRINVQKIIKEMNKHVYFSTYLFLHAKNIQFKIGFTNMSIQEIQENILSGLLYVMKFKLQNQWKAIKCIYLRTKDSPALPVYSHVNFELYEFLQRKIQEKEKEAQPTMASGAEGSKKKKKTADTVVAVVAKPEEPVAEVVAAETKKKRKHVEEEVVAKETVETNNDTKNNKKKQKKNASK